MANKGTLKNFKYSLTNVPIKMKTHLVDIILYLMVLKGEVSLLNLGVSVLSGKLKHRVSFGCVLLQGDW